MTPSSTSPYLSYSALERVTTLIKYLATHDNQAGVTSLMAGQELPINGFDPQKTSAEWEQTARSHTGFFEVYQGQQNVFLRLSERHIQVPPRPRLTAERITALQDRAVSHSGTTISLSEHQLERTKMWVSAFTALVGVAIGSLVTYYLTGK